MFQGLSIKFKKTFKNTQSKKANKGKTASLESTRSTSLNKSFTEQFNNLGVNDNTYERTLARIIENQEEILSELKVIKDKVGRIENRLNNLEQKMDNSFNITNDKAFKETEKFSEENSAKRALTKKTDKTRNPFASITNDREDSIINNVFRLQCNTRRPLRSIQNEVTTESNRIELEKKRAKQNEQEIKLTQDENLFKR
ncbi:62_t:CDS:2 [Gigaspora margarita]|uniref:62_t:CDS:1 n=1 Tax=Gigaspora margarita TaxID=4874 RepID=A0ABN7VW98_GIGMA|nr:62_t:CDS:2 [Gigaspora margarita]